MHPRVVLLLALVACDAPAPPPEAAPPAWVYAPPPSAWPLGAMRGRIGRSQAPQPAPPAGITGDLPDGLRQPTPRAVPGDGPARAVIYGTVGGKPAVELVDVDAGRVVWRDTEACAGPIVGVTAETVVCADAGGTRGLSLDRKTTWQSASPFVAMTDEHVVVGAAGGVAILDVASGDELARITIPAGVDPESIVASCGDVGRELFATTRDGALVRIADAKGGPAIAWTAPLGMIGAVDACEGDTVLVEVATPTGRSLVALARATGAPSGRVDGVRGSWKARTGDGVEVATIAGVALYPRALTAGTPLPLPPLGELIATRGERRLVRATPLTAVVLDRAGVRAFVPLAELGAVLGDHAIVAATWTGSAGETVHRIGLPPRYARVLRLPPRNPGVAVPTELRDLPAVAPLELAGAIASADAGKHAAPLLALDPARPTVAYAVVLEQAPDAAAPSGLAAVDVATRAWTWRRADGCGPGTPVGIAVAAELIVCAASGERGASVRATGRDGGARWAWDTEAIDAIQAAGDTIVVHTADRALVLDAATGRPRAHLASDDGAPVRAAAVAVDAHTTALITYERGRIVARLPAAGMIPVWSLGVDGVVREIVASDGGALIALEDGDAYRVDARTGEAWAIAGLNLRWQATGDVVTGAAPGGDIPGIALPQPPVPGPMRRRTAQGRPIPPSPEEAERPRLWTPIPPPPPLGESYQLAVYELNGALRVRNDYGVLGEVALASARGPAASPLVVTYGDGEALVLDPRTGDPLRRVGLPTGTPSATVFSTVVDGKPVAGVVLAQPLRLVLF